MDPVRDDEEEESMNPTLTWTMHNCKEEAGS